MTSGRSGFNPEPAVVTHMGVTCDHCSKVPLVGVRYKCLTCPDFDLCEACVKLNDEEKTNFHNRDHLFLRISKPVSFNDATTPTVLVSRSRMVHNINCTNCRNGIVGLRYFCTSCAINLCESCELISNRFHDVSHNMMKMKPPATVVEPTVTPATVDPIPNGNTVPIRRMLHLTSGRSGYNNASPSESPNRMPSPPRMLHTTSGRQGFAPEVRMLHSTSGRSGYDSNSAGNVFLMANRTSGRNGFDTQAGPSQK